MSSIVKKSHKYMLKTPKTRFSLENLPKELSKDYDDLLNLSL